MRGSPTPEVEQDRRRHDRHARRPDRRAPMPRSSSQRITPPAASRPKALPPASSTACTLLDRVQRRQQLGLARAGRGAAHVDAGDGAVAREHDGAAGRAARVGEVADREAGDASSQAARRRSRRRSGRRACLRSGEHAGRVLHARDTSPRWCSVSPKVISMHRQALEVVARRRTRR